jgi:hypothetical protein
MTLRSGTAPPAPVPKLFVSYSWTTPDHEAWVLALATELRESGVDVILDKWDLREGHDAHAFMEKMVTDPDIKKVILICDKAYVDKTDGRSGGVGTEAQIISGKIYENQAQGKFVAIAKERDENGQPYLPAYYKSRIYIDLSDPSRRSENFDRLLRWAHDRPLYTKPDLGEKPTYLLSDSDHPIVLRTSPAQKRAVDALRNRRDYAIPATAEYLKLLAGGLEKFRLDGALDPFDDAVVQSIESFLPYRNEALEVFTNLAVYINNNESGTVLHRFFEEVIPYLDRPEDAIQWRGWDYDNFRFIIQEMFLYAVASLVRFERFDSAAYLMNSPYYAPGFASHGRDVMASFEVLLKPMESLDRRNVRLNLSRLSVRADLLRERCKGTGTEFHHLMQADFALFMHSAAVHTSEVGYWLPQTLVLIGDHSGPFEVFARSRSAAYFNKTKVLLGVDSKEALGTLLSTLDVTPDAIPRWSYRSFRPAHLLGFERIATLP